MSWHYCYYIGLENKQTKIIEPFGIYDSFNKLIPIIDHSRSFATDIKDYFYDLSNEKIDAITSLLVFNKLILNPFMLSLR